VRRVFMLAKIAVRFTLVKYVLDKESLISKLVPPLQKPLFLTQEVDGDGWFNGGNAEF
jgi:hypothetical protein